MIAYFVQMMRTLRAPKLPRNNSKSKGMSPPCSSAQALVTKSGEQFGEEAFCRGTFPDAERDTDLHPGPLNTRSVSTQSIPLATPTPSMSKLSRVQRVSLLWAVRAFPKLEHGTWCSNGCAAPAGVSRVSAICCWNEEMLSMRISFPPLRRLLVQSELLAAGHGMERLFSRHHTPPLPQLQVWD